MDAELSIHGAVKLTRQIKRFSDFTTTKLVCTDGQGNEMIITLFSAVGDGVEITDLPEE